MKHFARLLLVLAALAWPLTASAHPDYDPKYPVGCGSNSNPQVAGCATYSTDMYNFNAQEKGAEENEYGWGNFVNSGCLGATAAGLTHTPTSCVAYNANMRGTETGSITYPNNSTCWVAFDVNRNGANASLPNFARVAGTHYLIDCVDASAPAMPRNAQLLMKVTTSGGAITAVQDYRVTGSVLNSALLNTTALFSNGPYSLAGATSGGNPVNNADINGGINPLGHGVVCNGSLDNAAAMQSAMALAGLNNGKTGRVQIPANCNSSSGHTLRVNSTLTIPDNVCLEGLGGPCLEGTGASCVEIDYGGAGGDAVYSTATHGACLRNVKIHNVGTGSIGLHLDGTFDFHATGVAIDGGFTGSGVKLTDCAASDIWNYFEGVHSVGNNVALYLDGTCAATKAIGGNVFIGDRFYGSTGPENILMTSYSSTAGVTGYQNVYQNLFSGLDMSQGNNIGLVSNATLNTFMAQVTAESLATTLQLNAGTQNFSAQGIEGAVNNTTTTGPLQADPSATYDINWGYLGGVGGSERVATQPVRQQYIETAGLSDATGSVGIGPPSNLVLWSEDQSKGNWVKVNITATAAAANNPAGTALTASSLALTGGSNAILQQTYTIGGGTQIFSTCWAGSLWARTSAGAVRMQMQLLNNPALLQLAAGGVATYNLTQQWRRIWVTGCAGPTDSNTGITWRAFYIASAAPATTVYTWGAQLQQVAQGAIASGPGPYVATTSAIVNLPGVLLTTPTLQFNQALTGLGGGAAPTLGTIGSPGPLSAAQNSWLKAYDSSGAAFYLPIWK